MSNHPKCETCAHYDTSGVTGFDHHPIYRLARCAATPHGTDATKWSDDGEDVLLPEYAETTAFAMDGSGYHAALSVRPDHYCAMHSALLAELSKEAKP